MERFSIIRLAKIRQLKRSLALCWDAVVTTLRCCSLLESPRRSCSSFPTTQICSEWAAQACGSKACHSHDSTVQYRQLRLLALLQTYMLCALEGQQTKYTSYTGCCTLSVTITSNKTMVTSLHWLKHTGTHQACSNFNAEFYPAYLIINSTFKKHWTKQWIKWSTSSGDFCSA